MYIVIHDPCYPFFVSLLTPIISLFQNNMAVETLLRFYSLNLIFRNKLPVLSYSINSVADWVYRRFLDSSGLSLNYNGAEFCLTQYEKTTQSSQDILWMAAPKKRTSRKTKWLRHQRKFIKNRDDIETCSVCGNAKLMNHLCGTCFERIQQETEVVLKSIQSQPDFWRPSVPASLKQSYRK